MQGIAQKLFLERSLGRLTLDSKSEAPWPLLDKMLRFKCVNYVDISLAYHILGKYGDEKIAALICHLSMASRYGHVCVKIEEACIQPHPAEIWVAEEALESSEVVSLMDYERLYAFILEGTKGLSSSLLCEVEKSAYGAPIYKHKNNFYLHKYWHLETTLLKGFVEHFKDSHLHFPVNTQVIDKKVDELVLQNKLLPEQALAILQVVKSSLTLITGGPGTGKTYTAGFLLRILWESLEAEGQANFKVALAAPTGKAASNLEESIRKALKGLEGFPSVKGQTLHQLLGIRKNRNSSNQMALLTADLILVDESSMIDLEMMGKLLAAVKPGARLVLLGDRYQLPSVEAGAVFADFITYFLSSGSFSPVIELKTCLRAELKGIVDLADSIKRGDSDVTLKSLETTSEGTRLVKFEDRLTIKEQQKCLLNYVFPYFPLVSKLPDDPFELLKLFAKFRVLVPMRKGLLGVDALNMLIFQKMREKMASAYYVVPIIVMENDYRQNLFNGEVGVLIKDQNDEYAIFASRESENQVRKIPLLMMPYFEYAYCLSVHKSQGSEFDHVVLVLSDGVQSFGKEALYTGVTRAKRRLEIWSSSDILIEMMGNVGLRRSGIVDRLSA